MVIYLAITLALSLAFVAVWAIRTLAVQGRENNKVLAAFAHDAEAERQILLERIQRPERVPVETATDPSPEPLHIPYDDDAAYTAYIQQNGAE